MGIVIYKVLFLEKILKWSIKQNFPFFCSLLVYTIKFILIYMQLIVIIEKFLKKPRFFWRGGGSYHLLFCIIHFLSFFIPTLMQKNNFKQKSSKYFQPVFIASNINSFSKSDLLDDLI